jgi:hypothetical protein
MSMRRAPIAVALLLAGLSAAVAHAESSSPTKKDPRWSEAGRHRILMLTDKLQKNPLANDAKKDSTEVMEWWTDVPDLTLHVCAGPFLDGKNEKTKPILLLQMMFGEGASILQSGAKQPTQEAATMAGARSALEAYKNAVKIDASYRDPFVDALVADPAKLKAYLDAKLAGCRKADQKAAQK